MGEVVVFVEDLKSGYGVSNCRICHEDEFENSLQTLEAPCACSGTVKVNGEKKKERKEKSSVLLCCVVFCFVGVFWIWSFLLVFFFFFLTIVLVSWCKICSLRIEIVYRGGVTRRETQPAKYAFRFDFVFFFPFLFFFLCVKSIPFSYFYRFKTTELGLASFLISCSYPTAFYRCCCLSPLIYFLFFIFIFGCSKNCLLLICLWLNSLLFGFWRYESCFW